jgi:hypothetical protein
MRAGKISAVGIIAGVSLMCGAAYAQQPPKAPTAASLTAPGAAAADNVGLTRSTAPGKPATSFGKFSAEVAAAAIARVCETGQGIAAAADGFGLPSLDTPMSVRWSVPADARVWRVESTDSTVFLYAYGSAPEHCGALIARPMVGAVTAGIKTALTAPGRNYVVDSQQDQGGGNQFIRFRSSTGRFIDVTEYAANGDNPPLIKMELLAK